MAFNMWIHVTGNGHKVICLNGAFSTLSAPQVKQEILLQLESGAINQVVDLTEVDYIDDTGLGVLVRGLKRLRELEGNLVLVCPNPRIRRVFEITGLDKTFNIYNTVEEAEEAIFSDPLPPAA